MDLKTNTVLFGFPLMVTKIDPTSYNKKHIVSTIEKNFKLKKTNRWDKQSILQYAYADFSNPKYHKVNFDTLLPIYNHTLGELFKKIGFFARCDMNFIIVNYTCLGKSNYMVPHMHPEADFIAVPYVQFDQKNHFPTVFENILPHATYIDFIRPDLSQILSNQDVLNSWAYKSWTPTIEEDDFCLCPSFLRHRIDPQASKKKNRITVVLNITLKKKISKKK